jgi:hypothetical protein
MPTTPANPLSYADPRRRSRRRAGGKPDKPRRPWGRRLRKAAFLTALLLCALFDFGLSGPDSAAVRSFIGETDRWQVNPEFRTVAIDYSVYASNAMRIHPAMVPARRVIMGVRSLPFMPKEFAVNPTSQLHYTHFSAGPLSAYLHLCSEQDMPDFLPLVETMGQKPNPTDADLRGFLDLFKMDFPVVKDAGARRSVAALLQDTDPARPFTVRTNITDLLAPDVAEVAKELGVPTDPARMNPDQQLAVLERLDGYVHHHDPELWRTKQVSDFCGGIWAQVFGPPYKFLLVPALYLHTASQFAIVLLLLTFAGASVRRRRLAERAAGQAGEDQPGSSSQAAEGRSGEPAPEVADGGPSLETGSGDVAPA